MDFFEIIKPDDWHVHFREGQFLKLLVPETSKLYDRCIVMPNLSKPIQSELEAIEYRKEILKYSINNPNFYPFLTFYLSENIDVSDLEKAYKNKNIFAAKLYPAGATTNSSKGVRNIKNIYHILDKMSEIKMPLLIHGEVNEKEIDVFYREQVFIEKILEEIVTKFPDLKITLEHITSKFAVDYIKNKDDNLKASITPHHLMLNRTDMLAHNIKPHYYCLPILKKEEDRKALIEVATSGNKNFFLGTDSAPHTINMKEQECGCAGVFNTINSVQSLTQLFENYNRLKNLEKFLSINGSNHYGLKINKNKIKLKKHAKCLDFKKYINFSKNKIRIFEPPFQVYWDIVE